MRIKDWNILWSFLRHINKIVRGRYNRSLDVFETLRWHVWSQIQQIKTFHNTIAALDNWNDSYWNSIWWGGRIFNYERSETEEHTLESVHHCYHSSVKGSLKNKLTIKSKVCSQLYYKDGSCRLIFLSMVRGVTTIASRALFSVSVRWGFAIFDVVWKTVKKTTEAVCVVYHRTFCVYRRMSTTLPELNLYGR